MLNKQKLSTLVQSKSFQLFLIATAILVLIPIFIRNSFFMFVFTLIFIFGIYAASWNFLANSGQGSLGHAVFLGIGGFASAIIGTKISVAIISASGVYTMPIGFLSVLIQVLVILVGGLLSAGIGLLIGLACVRLKAWYLAIVTFGFSVIAETLSSQFDSITNGINGFPPATFVPSGYPFYLLVILFAVASISVMYLLMKSRMGLAFRAIHGNEAEARMIGINTAKYKLIAFVISTFFAGLAGGLYVYFYGFVDNSIFSPTNSFTPLIMTVIGGLGTVAGPVVGSIFFTSVGQILSTQSVTQSLNNTLGPFFPNAGYVGPPLTYLFIGVILLVIVIFFPKGLTPLFHKFYKYIMTEEKPERKKA
ncbi:MAG: branched-chain amino acid ABC transporter permease [Candidatus Bathyarchaeia archaeon]|jgi:branched-chain amino acid transport system permease protein